MLGDDMRSAAARRDEGIRKITRLTWRAGLAGVICSAGIAVAFGHHAGSATTTTRPPPGSIVVPNQPPAPAKGAGQVTSGAS